MKKWFFVCLFYLVGSLCHFCLTAKRCWVQIQLRIFLCAHINGCKSHGIIKEAKAKSKFNKHKNQNLNTGITVRLESTHIAL